MTMEDHKLQHRISNPLPNKHIRVMEKVKATLLMQYNSEPDSRLFPSQIALIQRQFLSAFPVFHVPCHPTYSVMIVNAIKKLNEEDGSNEESISKYIKENYDDLPWAHNTYLSHHLNELCRCGELVCTCGKFYSTPALIPERHSRKKRRKRRFGKKLKGHVLEDEEGDSGGEQMVELRRNLTGFQEDSVVFEKNRVRVKRRRRSLVVDDDDEEAGGVGGDKDVKSSSQNLVVPLQDGDDSTEKGSGVSEEWGGVGTAVGEAAAEDGDVLYSPLELDDVACEGITKPELPLLPSSVHAERDENIKKISSLNDMRDDDDVGAEKLSNIRVDALEPVVKQSIELRIVPFVGNNSVTAVSDEINPSSELERVDFIIICGLASPKLEQPKPKRKQQVYFTKKRLKLCNEKTKVSLESIASFPALSVSHNLLEHKQVHELSETKLYTTLLESPKLKVLSVGESQQACTSSLLEVGVVEQFERQNPLGASHHPSSLEELKSVVDVENLPFQRVLAKFAKRKQHVVQLPTVKCPLATELSSIPGSKLQGNQPDFENYSRMMPVIVPEVTLTKSPEKHWRRKLKPQVQKHCNVDQGNLLQLELTAETFSSIDEPHDWEDNQQTSGALDFPCEVKQSTEVNAVASAPTLHLNGLKEKLEIDETVAFDTDLLTTAEVEDCKSLDKVKKKPTKQSQGRPFKAMSTVDDLLEVSTPPQCHDGMEDEEGKSKCLVCHHEPETVAASSKKHIVATVDRISHHLINQSQWETRKRPFEQKDGKEEATATSLLLQHQCHGLQDRPSEPATSFIVEETYSKTCQIDIIKSHELEPDGKNLCPDVDRGSVATGHVASDNSLGEQERRKMLQITRLSLPEPSLRNSQHKMENQGQSQDDVRLQDLELEAIMATFPEGNIPSASQKDEARVKRALGILSQTQLVVKKEDLVPPSNELLQHQEGLSRPSTHWNLKQRGRPRKASQGRPQKAGRGRPQKAGQGRPQMEKEAVKREVVDSMNLLPQLHGFSKQAIVLHSQQQMELLEVGNQRSHNQIEATRENVVAFPNLHLQLQAGLSELTTDHDSHTQIKQQRKDGRGKPQKQIGATKDDKPPSLNVDMRPQEEFFELAVSQNSSQEAKLLVKKGQGRQQGQATKEAEASSNLHMQLQGGSYKPATDHHFQKQTRKVKMYGRGRSWKQLEASNEDGTAFSILHVHREKLSSELGTHQHSQQKLEPSERKGRGRPRKQMEASKEDATALSNLLLQQQAMSTEPETRLKKDGRGRPQKQGGTEKEDAASIKLLLMEQEWKSPPATYQYSQSQNKRPKREGQGQFLKQKEEAVEVSAGALDIHFLDQTVLLELAARKESNQFESDNPGRTWNQQVHKEHPATPSSLFHQLEDRLSDKEKEHKVDDCPDTEPEKSQNEIQNNKMTRSRSIVTYVPSDDAPRDQHKLHVGLNTEPEKLNIEVQGTPEIGQAKKPSNVDIHRCRRDKKLHGGSQQPKTRALQQELQCCHGQEERTGKFEGEVRLPKG